MVCSRCGQKVEPEHRFCPWCATPQQRKAVALFRPHPHVHTSGRGLRVSRYFDPADGPPHTRVSVYDGDGRITCVVALDDATTDELARFLTGLALPRSTEPPSVLDRLRGRR